MCNLISQIELNTLFNFETKYEMIFQQHTRTYVRTILLSDLNEEGIICLVKNYVSCVTEVLNAKCMSTYLFCHKQRIYQYRNAIKEIFGLHNFIIHQRIML